MVELVNLDTRDRSLEDYMLAEYPGRILDAQYEKKKTPEGHIFCFYDLDLDTLAPFLASWGGTDWRVTNRHGKVIEECF